MQEKKYTVSEDGIITSKNGKVLKYRIRNGKYQVNLNIFGKTQTFIVARIVYNYFNPMWDIRSKFVIGYKDGNPLNIHIDNLYLRKRTDILEHKLSPDEEKEVKRLYLYGKANQKELAIKYNVSLSLIKKLVKKEA